MKKEQKIVKVIRWINLTFVGLFSLCVLTTVAQANCIAEANERFTFEPGESTYDHSGLDFWMMQCIFAYGQEYARSTGEIPAKQDIRTSPTDFGVVLGALSRGHFTGGGDRPILENVKRFAELVHVGCGRDDDFKVIRLGPHSPVPMTFPPITEQANMRCIEIARLREMGLELQVGRGPDDPNVLTGQCLEEDTRTALICARACEALGGTGTPCSHGSRAYPSSDLWARARACASGARTAGCDACDLNRIDDDPSCTAAPVPVAIVPDEEVVDETPDTPITPSTVAEEDPINTPPDDATTQDDLDRAVETAANNVFGNEDFNLDRTQPNGSLQVPAVKMDLNLDSGSLANPTMRASSNVSPVATTSSDPSLLFPREGRGTPGSAGLQQPGAGQPPGAPPFRGGGPGGGFGANNPGAPGAGAKGRRGGRRGSNLGQIADRLGGNSFMGADGKKSNSRPPNPEGNPLDPRVREKMLENQARSVADKNALNSQLAGHLMRAGATKRELFLKASWFPEKTDVYIEMIETRDLLNPEGL